MNIKRKLRALLEEQAKKPLYEYGAVMLYLDVDKQQWDKVVNTIDKDDLYMGDEGESDTYGKEMDPHVTILYGIHSDVPDSEVEAIIKDIESPNIDLYKVSTFKNEKFDVLKFDVESPELVKLNKKFTDNVEYTSEYPDYHAHATIAYLLKGTAPKYIKQFKDFDTISLKPDRIIYSKPSDDGKDKKIYKIGK